MNFREIDDLLSDLSVHLTTENEKKEEFYSVKKGFCMELPLMKNYLKRSLILQNFQQ